MPFHLTPLCQRRMTITQLLQCPYIKPPLHWRRSLISYKLAPHAIHSPPSPDWLGRPFTHQGHATARSRSRRRCYGAVGRSRRNSSRRFLGHKWSEMLWNVIGIRRTSPNCINISAHIHRTAQHHLQCRHPPNTQHLPQRHFLRNRCTTTPSWFFEEEEAADHTVLIPWTAEFVGTAAWKEGMLIGLRRGNARSV